MVARAGGAGPSVLAREAVAALSGVASEPAALVTGCRRLVERHPEAGPIWWLAARMLSAPDPMAEARVVARLLDEDDTAGVVAAELPPDSTAVVVGWPEQLAVALRRRGDVEALVVDWDGEGDALSRRLSAAGSDSSEVPSSGVAAAVVVADIVLVEAVSAGADGLLATPGSRAAAAVAAHAGVPVWAAVGAARVLPRRLWEAQLAHLDASGAEPWYRSAEVVPVELLTSCVGPRGPFSPLELADRADCPAAPELLRAPGR